MKLSELKEQIKELYLQEENSVEDIEAKTKATQDLTAATQELNKVTMKEFKNYLRQEILAEITEQEEDESVELGDLEGEEEIATTIEEPAQDKALELDDIGDTLVQLARRAKDVDERELANQILNSAKFAKKTEFKKVEKDAGIGDEQA
jgi:hypothetical protein